MSSIQYMTTGQGQDSLLLLHGFCEDHRIWEVIGPDLAEYFQVIAPDLPGFGQSEVLAPSLDSWAEKLAEILDEESIPTCHVIGHSMGGYTALAFAEKYPERVKSLTLFHSSALADQDEKRANRFRVAELVRNGGSSGFIRQLIPTLYNPDSDPSLVEGSLQIGQEQSPEGIAQAAEAMAARPDRTSVLSGAHFPVLILSGAKDTLLPLEQQAGLAALPPVSRFEVLHHSGHMGMVEEPDRAVEILLDFLGASE